MHKTRPVGAKKNLMNNSDRRNGPRTRVLSKVLANVRIDSPQAFGDSTRGIMNDAEKLIRVPYYIVP